MLQGYLSCLSSNPLCISSRYDHNSSLLTSLHPLLSLFPSNGVAHVMMLEVGWFMSPSAHNLPMTSHWGQSEGHLPFVRQSCLKSPKCHLPHLTLILHMCLLPSLDLFSLCCCVCWSSNTAGIFLPQVLGMCYFISFLSE
jgi:hypothetical protein